MWQYFAIIGNLPLARGEYFYLGALSGKRQDAVMRRKQTDLAWFQKLARFTVTKKCLKGKFML